MIDNCLGKEARPAVVFSQYPVFTVIRNYVFDFIWAFAMTNTLYIILNNNAKPYMICMLAPVILGSIMEVLQLLEISQGTFDFWDIVAEGFGTVLGAVIINIFRRFLNDEK